MLKVGGTSFQRRQDRETERRERIFKDKVRTMGVDKEALDMQVKDRRRQEEAEKERQQTCDADMLRHSKAATLLHSRQMKERHAMEKALVDYRHQYQQPWSRQEYDLNDPDRCKKTDPGDAHMMLPGLVGEDPDSEGRRQRQREQLRGWLVQQQREQAAERHQRGLAEWRYDQRRAEMDNKALQLQSAHIQMRRAAAVAAKEYNLAQIKEKVSQGDGVDHVPGQLTGADIRPTPGMMGAPGLCPSSDGTAPPVVLQQIVQFQKFQIEERKRTELEKKQQEEQQDRIRLDSARAAMLIERQQARLRKQLRQHVDSTNIKLAQIHKEQKPDIERGRVDDSFFSNFNTCSR